MEVLLPLLGVALGWGLKTLSDYLVSRKAETRIFRKATFYLLKDYKALFDYDRGTTYFRRKKPPVNEFEPWRAILERRFLEESQANSGSVSTAIELLASVDPPLAIRLHNSLKNIAFVFRKNLGEAAEQDEKTYAELLYTQDKLVATTLQDLHTALLHTAKCSGFGQRRKVEAWIRERLNGESDFSKGMEQQEDLRNRAMALERSRQQATP